jgi:hypothetical protein
LTVERGTRGECSTASWAEGQDAYGVFRRRGRGKGRDLDAWQILRGFVEGA